jgi:predicted metal-dependent peptidase
MENNNSEKSDLVIDNLSHIIQLICVSLPYVANLAYKIKCYPSDKTNTIGVSSSGRIIINPNWFNPLEIQDKVFVMAHEIMHLVLMTHDRGSESDAKLVNIAHDYIINDILKHELNQKVPAGGLSWDGARYKSLEEIVLWLEKEEYLPDSSWENKEINPVMLRALNKSGLIIDSDRCFGLDVINNEHESSVFPKTQVGETKVARELIRELAIKANEKGVITKSVKELFGLGKNSGQDSGNMEISQQMLRTLYKPPWEMAMQQWIEATSPGKRTYFRPNRRSSGNEDFVLAGRNRTSWTLHIVLDTSGSMSNEFGRILGAIASFCEAADISAVHIIQCDVEVTKDELIRPEDLALFSIAGYGGSDMSQGMRKLAEDPEVQVCLVITDGCIYYPPEIMPYHVLWILTESRSFNPPYGQVIHLKQ